MEPKSRTMARTKAIRSRADKLNREIARMIELGSRADDHAENLIGLIDRGVAVAAELRKLNATLNKLHLHTDKLWATAQELTAAVVQDGTPARASA